MISASPSERESGYEREQFIPDRLLQSLIFILDRLPFDFDQEFPYKGSVTELTAQAALQLLALVREKGLSTDEAGLRLGIERGGCAGLQYAMTIGLPAPDDQCIERDGARLYVAADSIEQLSDSVVDYDDGLAGAGFRIRNPKASRSCGCGTSFEPGPTS